MLFRSVTREGKVRMERYYIPGTKGSVFSLRGEFSFGVDSILLSAFSKTKSVNLAVDLCSGSGIVALRNTRCCIVRKE